MEGQQPDTQKETTEPTNRSSTANEPTGPGRSASSHPGHRTRGQRVSTSLGRDAPGKRKRQNSEEILESIESPGLGIPVQGPTTESGSSSQPSSRGQPRGRPRGRRRHGKRARSNFTATRADTLAVEAPSTATLNPESSHPKPLPSSSTDPASTASTTLAKMPDSSSYSKKGDKSSSGGKKDSTSGSGGRTRETTADTEHSEEQQAPQRGRSRSGYN